MKAGGAYLPLDLSYPQQHIEFILAETQAPCLLVDRRLMDQVPKQYPGEVLCFDDIAEQYDSPECLDNATNDLAPENLASIFYTSGSTGQPKGVEHDHHYFTRRLAWCWQTFPFAENEIMCQRTTANFVVSMWEFLGGLLQGVPTVILPDEVAKDPRRLAKTLSEEKVTRLLVVPSLLKMILELQEDVEKYLSGVKWWVSWKLRHQHPVSLALHAVGIPATAAAAWVAIAQLLDGRWDLWWRPALLFVIGYALQWVGHRIEGNTMGELILFNKLFGLPYTRISRKYQNRDSDLAPPQPFPPKSLR